MGHRVYCRYSDAGYPSTRSIGGIKRINQLAKEMIEMGFISSLSTLKVNEKYDSVYSFGIDKHWYTGKNYLFVIGRTDGNNRYIRNIIITEFCNGNLYSVKVMDIKKRVLIPSAHFGHIKFTQSLMPTIVIGHRDDLYLGTMITLESKDYTMRCVNDYNSDNMFK